MWKREQQLVIHNYLTALDLTRVRPNGERAATLRKVLLFFFDKNTLKQVQALLFYNHQTITCYMKTTLLLLVASLILTISCTSNNDSSGTISIKIINQDSEIPNHSFEGYAHVKLDHQSSSSFFMFFDYVPGVNVENEQANNFIFEKVVPGIYEFEIESSCATKIFTVDYKGGNYSTDLVIEDCQEESPLFMTSVFESHF